MTPAQVIFAWVLAKGVVIVTTSSKKERLEEYLEVGDIGTSPLHLYWGQKSHEILPCLAPLTKEDVDAIDEAGLRS